VINPPTLPNPATPDLFHRYLDRRMRSARGVGNGSQFVFELKGEVDVELLRSRLADVSARLPVLTAGLQSWPGRTWRPVADHVIPLREVVLDGSVDSWFGRWFGEPFAPVGKPSLELVVGRGDGRTAVLVRWLHALADAPGMDLLCRLLDGEDPKRFKLHVEPSALVRRVRGERSLWGRGLDLHQLVFRHLARSLPPPYQPRIDRRARQTVSTRTLTREETAATWARAARLGGLDRNAFLVGALARACVRAWQPASWRSIRIPVPISLRPPAWRGPVLGNWFSMVLLQVPVRRLRTLEEAVGACRSAWRLALSRGEDRATMTLMGPAAVLPPWIARLFLDGPRLRDGATVNTSYVELQTGRKAGTWLGQPLERAIIASSILAPPGLAGIFAGCAGRLSVAVPGQAGASAEALHAELVALLLGETE
jgi:hypothetical protein